MEAIWEYGCDYDGETTVKGLKELIDELINCSRQARKCLQDGKIFFDKDQDLKNRKAAYKEQEAAFIEKIGYCPLCDKMVEKKTDQEYIRCPYCGHRIELREKI